MTQTNIGTYSVEVVRDDTQGAYLFGVTIDGYFVTIAQRKLGRLDQQRALAQTQAETPPFEPTPEG